MDPIDLDAVASLEPDEVDFDQDLALGETGEDDVINRSWVAPDRPLFSGHHGETAAEQAEGSSLEERLAAELPDVDGARPGEEVLPSEQPLDDALGEDVAAEDLVVTDDRRERGRRLPRRPAGRARRGGARGRRQGHVRHRRRHRRRGGQRRGGGHARHRGARLLSLAHGTPTPRSGVRRVTPGR
jgi:hypothetical protein